MAVPTDITTGVQTVSAPGPVAGTLDVSGVVGDHTICLLITTLTAGKTCRLSLEASSDAFANTTSIELLQFTGPQLPVADLRLSIRRYQLPNSIYNDFGFVGNKIRINVLALDPNSVLGLHVWLEQ
jgi:hypothetical protein